MKMILFCVISLTAERKFFFQSKTIFMLKTSNVG